MKDCLRSVTQTAPSPRHDDAFAAPSGSAAASWHTRVLRDPSWHLAVLLALAIVLGGYGVNAGLRNFVVQLAAILVIALHPQAFALFFLRRPSTLTVLVLLSVLVPLIQLIPLPPALWMALPGRDMVVSSLAASGIDMAASPPWFPISLAPSRTLVAAVGTLVPLAVIVVGSVLPAERRRWLAGTVVLTAWVVIAFGLKRLLNPTAYDLAHATGAARIDRLGGLIANSNTAALFFVSCLLLMIAFIPRRKPGQHGAAAYADTWKILLHMACAVMLVLCTFLTKSRTGTVLLILPLGLLGLKAFASRFTSNDAAARRSAFLTRTILAIAVVGAVALTVTASTTGGRLGAAFDRLGSGDTGKRAEIHLDALQAVKRYWPIGSGMGTLDEVFQVDESLEHLSPRRTGRAHLEYYELALEAGPAALAIAASWLLWLLVATWKALRTWDWAALAGAAILAGCAMQSLMLFPLRTQSMLAVAALAVVLLGPAMRKSAESLRHPSASTEGSAAS